MDYQKADIHFNGKSWCHNIKLLSDDGKIKYSKRAGFQTSEEALQSAVSYEERFKEDLRKFHLKNKIDCDDWDGALKLFNSIAKSLACLLKGEQLIEEVAGYVRLTEHGIDVSNYVLAEFLL